MPANMLNTRLRETGSPAPAKFGGYRTCSLEPHRDVLLAQIEVVPHLTLHRLKDMLAERGIAVSHDTVWRFLKREGRSFKDGFTWRSCSISSRAGLSAGR